MPEMQAHCPYCSTWRLQMLDPSQGPGTVDLDAIDGGDDDGALSEDAARKYFLWLSRTAAAAGVSVDVLAAGSAAANVAALAPVAERSGGLLTLQKGQAPLMRHSSGCTEGRDAWSSDSCLFLREADVNLLWECQETCKFFWFLSCCVSARFRQRSQPGLMS